MTEGTSNSSKDDCLNCLKNFARLRCALDFYTFTLLAQCLQQVALLRFYSKNTKLLRNPHPMPLACVASCPPLLRMPPAFSGALYSCSWLTCALPWPVFVLGVHHAPA